VHVDGLQIKIDRRVALENINDVKEGSAVFAA